MRLFQGRFAGQPFRLHNWQKWFIRGFVRSDGDASLSVARGGGKSTLIGALGCAAVSSDGPLHQPFAETIICGSSFDQAKIVFLAVLAFLGEQVNDKSMWRLQDSTNRSILTNRITGASLRAIGSDPKRAHGRAGTAATGAV